MRLNNYMYQGLSGLTSQLIPSLTGKVIISPVLTRYQVQKTSSRTSANRAFGFSPQCQRVP